MDGHTEILHHRFSRNLKLLRRYGDSSVLRNSLFLVLLYHPLIIQLAENTQTSLVCVGIRENCCGRHHPIRRRFSMCVRIQKMCHRLIRQSISIDITNLLNGDINFCWVNKSGWESHDCDGRWSISQQAKTSIEQTISIYIVEPLARDIGLYLRFHRSGLQL